MSNTKWKVGLTALALVVSLVAGVSPLVDGSPLFPAIVGGIVVVLVISVLLLEKPVWALYVAIFVVLLPSLRGETALAQLLDTMQSVLNRSSTLIALASWLLSTITRRRQIIWTRPALLMVGFLIWGTLTLSWAPDLGRGIDQLAVYAFRLILYLLLIANQINSKETLDGLMRVLTVNGWILVLAGIGTLLFQGYEPGTRLQVLGMEQNVLGIKLLITAPGILWQAIHASEQQKAARMASSRVFVSLALVLVALSGSRAGAICWLVALLAFWFWKPTRPWGKLGLVLLTVAVIGAPLIFSTVVRRFSEAEGGLIGGRLVIWQASWLIVRDHPWVGLGIGNAGYVLSSYLRGMSPLFRRMDVVVSHNAILQIWTETGITGLLLYLSVLVSAVWSFVRQYCRCVRTRALSLIPYFALVSSVFAGIMLWWFEDGSAVYDSSYFLLLAFLLIPSQLGNLALDHPMEGDTEETGRGKWQRIDAALRSGSPS